jgi:hypothetical protein
MTTVAGTKMKNKRGVDLALRFAVVISFLYPPISAFFDPYTWVGYLPGFLGALPVNQLLLLHSFGVFEVLLAVWILLSKRPMVPSVIAALVLLCIVLFNLPQFEVLFRDVSILLAAVALALLHRQ